jgi:hypothetical protein
VAARFMFGVAALIVNGAIPTIAVDASLMLLRSHCL